MSIHHLTTDGLPDEPILTSLLDLLTQLFPHTNQSDWLSELNYQASRTGLQTQLVLTDQQVVGCKLGYERKPGHFYSWLGGVHADHRGRGIASELMRQQHDWCRHQNYHTIRTQTYNRWRDMLILNIRSGFDIIGTQQGKHGLVIVLEKKVA